jgi:hypothetical protein
MLLSCRFFLTPKKGTDRHSLQRLSVPFLVQSSCGGIYGFLLHDKLHALFAQLDDSDGARLYAGGDGGYAMVTCGTASLLAIHRIDLNLHAVGNIDRGKARAVVECIKR